MRLTAGTVPSVCTTDSKDPPSTAASGSATAGVTVSGHGSIRDSVKCSVRLYSAKQDTTDTETRALVCDVVKYQYSCQY